jgi:rhodanese-related sulfurtransferase
VAQHNPGFVALVDEARGRIIETDVAAVNARLKRGESLTLVDVREDNEFAAGRIPGAIHIGRGVLERDIETAIPDHDEEIILYCGGGYRSALAADNLQRMGYTNVISMDGGFRAWRLAGLPVLEAPEREDDVLPGMHPPDPVP